MHGSLPPRPLALQCRDAGAMSPAGVASLVCAAINLGDHRRFVVAQS